MNGIIIALVIVEIFFTWIPVYLVDRVIKNKESKRGN